MGRVNTPILTEQERTELEQGHRSGHTHAFRKRCHMVLLKADGRDSKDVGRITSSSHVSVNSWLKRHGQSGLEGLRTKPGRGRKPKLSGHADSDAVRQAVQANRQSLRTAKAEWEAQSGRRVGLGTLKAFLKSLAEDTNA